MLVLPGLIFLFHFSVYFIQDFYFGNSEKTYKSLLAFTSTGVGVTPLIFYYIDAEIMFTCFSILILVWTIASGVLMQLTHEHPSVIYKIQGVDSALPVSPYALRRQICNSIINSCHSFEKTPLATQNSVYEVNYHGVYMKSTNV